MAMIYDITRSENRIPFITDNEPERASNGHKNVKIRDTYYWNDTCVCQMGYQDIGENMYVEQT